MHRSTPPVPRVVAVTGGFGHLGQALARAFLQAGDRVVLIGHGGTAPALAPAPELVLAGVDLADPASTAAAFARIQDHCGRLDVLVHAAGGYEWERFEGSGAALWDRLYTMNLRTAVVACQAALPMLLAQGDGRIVCIGAQGASRGSAGNGPYAASKAGLLRLVESLADEFKDRRVTVNAVLPSMIDTPRNRHDMPAADFSRWVPAEAIADLILFLASDAARCITGAAIPIVNRA